MKKETVQKNTTDNNRSINSTYFKNLCYLLIIAIPVFTLYDYFSNALQVNGFLSFPLDDPWIHLKFGKNLKEYHSYIFNRNDSPTAGSTSPLYTFIVAAGFFFTDNEMLLSYVLGGLFFILSCIYFFKLIEIEFRDQLLLCLLGTLIFVFDYTLNFTALSGMETTLFIFLIILGTYFYKKNYSILLGITSGMILWTRPDGLAFVAAIFVHYIYCRFFVKKDENLKVFSTKQILQVFFIFACISLLYFMMNYSLSGTLLPNTYYAKMAYFIDPEKRINFLKKFVWVQFTYEHYFILMCGFIFSLVYFPFDAVKRKYNPSSFYLIFVFIFLIIYILKLPTVNKFGRYQIPAIPFFIIISLLGFRDFFALSKYFFKNSSVANLLTGISFVIIIYFSFSGYAIFRNVFAEMSMFTNKRQMAVANWINQNTDKNDVIAVHDVGAIGYYTDRQIVDVVGLITPEFSRIQNADNFSEILTDYFKKHGVKYTVFFNEFYNMKNQNPVFITPKGETREVFEINKFDPDKSKLLSGKAFRYILGSRNKENGNELIEDMNKALEIEPDCAIAFYVKALGYGVNKDSTEVRNNLKRSIECQPDFVPALIQLGTIEVQNKNFDEAKKYFLKVKESEPDNSEANYGLKLIDEMKKSF